MHDDLSRCWLDHQDTLLRHLRRSFPGAGVQMVEDAAASALLDCLRRPEGFKRCETDAQRLALLRCVAWRHLRAELRRKASRMELLVDRLPEGEIDAPQELLAGVVDRFHAALDEAVARHGGRDPDLLRAALEHRFSCGGGDTELARAFGLHRETLNRAKRLVQRRLWE